MSLQEVSLESEESKIAARDKRAADVFWWILMACRLVIPLYVEILVPGINYTGASDWSSTNWEPGSGSSASNASEFTTYISDPAKNLGISVHSYLDTNRSGTVDAIGSGVTFAGDLANVTTWLQSTNASAWAATNGILRCHVSEYAVSYTNGTTSGSVGLTAVQGLYSLIQANPTLYLGASWWSYMPVAFSATNDAPNFNLAPSGSTVSPSLPLVTPFFTGDGAA